MAFNRRVLRVPAAAVLAVLADGWSYADWVVGTRRVLRVDPGFPAPDASLHVRVGNALVSHEGRSTSLEWDPDAGRLTLEARALLLGRARIALRVEPAGDGASYVRLEEHALSTPLLGPLGPVLADPLVMLRNTLTLRRLGRVAVSRRPPTGPVRP